MIQQTSTNPAQSEAARRKGVAEPRHLPLDGSLPSNLVRLMALYAKPVCNLIGLAFDSGPLDRLIVIATPKRHCVAPKKDDDITFRNTIVATHTNFGRMGGGHDLPANRLRWFRQTSLAEHRSLVPIAVWQSPAKLNGTTFSAVNAGR